MIGTMQFKKMKGINMKFKRFNSISEIKKKRGFYGDKQGIYGLFNGAIIGT